MSSALRPSVFWDPFVDLSSSSLTYRTLHRHIIHLKLFMSRFHFTHIQREHIHLLNAFHRFLVTSRNIMFVQPAAVLQNVERLDEGSAFARFGEIGQQVGNGDRQLQVGFPIVGVEVLVEEKREFAVEKLQSVIQTT